MQPRTTPRFADGEPLIYTCPHATCTGDCRPRQLRAAGDPRPLLVIAPRGLKWPGCLNAGADAYLDSSFLPALTRHCRAGGPPANSLSLSSRLQVGDLRLDLLTYVARRGSQTIALTPCEARLLALLMRHAGETCSRSYILEQVWGTRHEPGSSVLETHMRRLREKIDDGFEIKLIHNVYGKGYVLKVDG